MQNTKKCLKNKCNTKCPVLCRKCYNGLLEKRKTNYNIGIPRKRPCNPLYVCMYVCMYV